MPTPPPPPANTPLRLDRWEWDPSIKRIVAYFIAPGTTVDADGTVGEKTYRVVFAPEAVAVGDSPYRQRPSGR